MVSDQQDSGKNAVMKPDVMPIQIKETGTDQGEPLSPQTSKEHHEQITYFIQLKKTSKELKMHKRKVKSLIKKQAALKKLIPEFGEDPQETD